MLEVGLLLYYVRCTLDLIISHHEFKGRSLPPALLQRCQEVIVDITFLRQRPHDFKETGLSRLENLRVVKLGESELKVETADVSKLPDEFIARATEGETEGGRGKWAIKISKQVPDLTFEWSKKVYGMRRIHAHCVMPCEMSIQSGMVNVERGIVRKL